jgi:formylglycine-generating enzyme required for sulfatase activity
MSGREPAAIGAARIARVGIIAAAIIALIGVLVTAYFQNRSQTPGRGQSVETEYIGRVIDASTLQPIANAKISLDLEGVPPVVYSDSEGVYHFKVNIQSELSGRLRVDAANYQTYTRNITISPEIKNIEDIRLVPMSISSPTPYPIPSTPTPNPTVVAMFLQASTPLPEFTPQIRFVDGVEQVWVPEGLFVAGDVSGIGYDDEKPLHIVFTDGFWMDRTTVTNVLYASCPESICSVPQKLNSHVRPNGYYGVPAFDNYPVIHVTWQQAHDFCEWRGGRLPTEAEFEKAAGWNPATGTTSIYPWGNLAPTDELANFNGIDRDTRPVGSYPQGMSATGAYDMAGNVWQWVSDWYSPTYYADNTEWRNPTGPIDGTDKVVRGGSWFSPETRWLRVSNRGTSVPDKVANEFGFRCVFDNY